MTELTIDHLIDVQDAYPSEYRIRGCWVMNRAHLDAVAKACKTEAEPEPKLGEFEPYMIRFNATLSDEDVMKIQERFKAAFENARVVPLSFGFSHEPIKRRPWWMFWRRG